MSIPVDLTVSDFKEKQSHKLDFLLWPQLWLEFSIDESTFAWKEYKLSQTYIDAIPDTPGVYTFVIKPGIANHPSCAYIIYVGQTTKQTLKARFKQYLYEQAGKGKPRQKILPIFNMFKDYLYFVCSPLESLSPKEVEATLLTTFEPYCNDQIPARVIKTTGAF